MSPPYNLIAKKRNDVAAFILQISKYINYKGSHVLSEKEVTNLQKEKTRMSVNRPMAGRG